MLKRIFLTVFMLFVTFFIWFPSKGVFANGEVSPVNIYLFYSEFCPHCEAEREFLDDFERQNPEKVKVYEYEVYLNEDNYNLLLKVAERIDISSQYVPITIICVSDLISDVNLEGNGTIGEECDVIIGYSDDGSTAEKIREKVDKCYEKICEEYSAGIEGKPAVTPVSHDKITIPIVGEVNFSDYSLPVLTILIAFFDGFNPCAMWVLLYLISILIGFQNRKKMWIIGFTFIFFSALIYFLFMTSWLNFFLFLGFVKWVRILVGVVAIISGGIHLHEYWENRKGCETGEEDKRKRILDKVDKITSDSRIIYVLLGIIALAFSVNLIELVCSAGFPAIYTHLLSLSNLSTLQYYLYLLLYIFVFMIDDMAIFAIAMFTLKVTGISTRYKRISSLVGGILILLIGLLLIFRPEVLMFS